MMLGVGATTQTAFACSITQSGCPTNPCGGTGQDSCTKPGGDGTTDYYSCLGWSEITLPSGESVMKCTSWHHEVTSTEQPGGGSSGGSGGGSGGGSSGGSGGGSSGGTTNHGTGQARITFVANINGNNLFDSALVTNFPDDVVKSCTGTGTYALEIPSPDMVRIDDARIRFTHWNRASDDSGLTNYQPGEKVNVQCGETLTLYAQWQSAPSDTTPPVISGADDATIKTGDAFDPLAGVTATDDIDGDLTSQIKVAGEVDTTQPGKTTLTYTVSDKAGNTATASRTITVQARSATIACAPQTGVDPAASIWQTATILSGVVAFLLAGVTFRLRRRSGM